MSTRLIPNALVAIALVTTSFAPSLRAEDNPTTSTTTSTNPPESTLPPDSSLPPESTQPPVSTTIHVLTSREVRVVWKVRTKKPVVFITIDDGGFVSKDLAKVIDRHHIPITTFAMPEMIWRSRKWFLKRQHMDFGSHTSTHAHMTLISPTQQVRELCRSNRLIRRITGTIPHLYRPPRGSWNERNKHALAKCGLKYIVMWNVVVTNEGVSTARLRRGDIIILHYVQSLAQSLKMHLSMIHRAGLRPALLSDYLP